MTAIIISILAALGIGGGLVIANNSGSSSGGAAVVRIQGEKTDYIAQVNPNYNLISAISDTKQYQATIGDNDAFARQFVSSSQQQTHLVAADEDYSIYGNPLDDLRNGLIRGEQIEGTPYYATLNLLRGIDTFHIFSSIGSEVYGINNIQKDVQNIFLTHDNFLTRDVNNRYDTYRYDDTDVYSSDTSVVFKHYNAIHLGGKALGLTVADFGHWEEKAWTESNSQKYLNMDNNKTFFFYDERFAYRNMYYKSTATMQGNVFVSVIVDRQTVDTVYNLQTGTISMDLDLPSRRITNGQVIMDNEEYRAAYNVENFTGVIAGSVFMIDGTGWQKVDPQVGALRGGVGKLLVGRDGLEMVGNFSKQIEYNGELDDMGRPDYDPGKADYTFGAKEL